MLQVKDLTIKWNHVRFYDTSNKMGGRRVKPEYNGMTTCRIFKDDTLIEEAKAYCTLSDNFCKDTGRKVSLERALREVLPLRVFRKMVWDAYNNMTNPPRW